MKWIIDIKTRLKGGEKHYWWLIIVVFWAIVAVLVSRLVFEMYGSREISICVWIYFLIYAMCKL